jgi:hypothetical protein
MLGTTNTTGGGQQQTYNPQEQQRKQQQQQAQAQTSQTFAQLQKQGMARPAPAAPQAQTFQQFGGSQQAQQMRQQLQQQLQDYGKAPSRFDTQAFQQIRGAQSANLNAEYQAQQKALNEDLARRGLSASSIGGGRMGDLAGQQSRALADLDSQLLQRAAETQAQDRAQMLAEGRGFAELASAQDLQQFEANRAGQAAQFEQELRGAEFGQRQYEQGSDQALRAAQAAQDYEKFSREMALRESELVGNVEGFDTLASQQQDEQSRQFNVEQGLRQVLGLGGMNLQQQQFLQDRARQMTEATGRLYTVNGEGQVVEATGAGGAGVGTLAAQQQRTQERQLAFQNAARLSEQSGVQYTVTADGNVEPLRDAQGNPVQTSAATQANLNRQFELEQQGRQQTFTQGESKLEREIRLAMQSNEERQAYEMLTRQQTFGQSESKLQRELQAMLQGQDIGARERMQGADIARDYEMLTRNQGFQSSESKLQRELQMTQQDRDIANRVAMQNAEFGRDYEMLTRNQTFQNWQANTARAAEAEQAKQDRELRFQLGMQEQFGMQWSPQLGRFIYPGEGGPQTVNYRSAAAQSDLARQNMLMQLMQMMGPYMNADVRKTVEGIASRGGSTVTDQTGRGNDEQRIIPGSSLRADTAESLPVTTLTSAREGGSASSPAGTTQAQLQQRLNQLFGTSINANDRTWMGNDQEAPTQSEEERMRRLFRDNPNLQTMDTRLKALPLEQQLQYLPANRMPAALSGISIPEGPQRQVYSNYDKDRPQNYGFDGIGFRPLTARRVDPFDPYNANSTNKSAVDYFLPDGRRWVDLPEVKGIPMKASDEY